MRRGKILVVLALAAAIAGCGSKPQRQQAGGETKAIEISVDGEGFHPNQLTVAAGKPATLYLTRTTDATCAKEIVIPSLNVNQPLPLNERVQLVITPKEKGEVAFACGMEMFTGVIHVE